MTAGAQSMQGDSEAHAMAHAMIDRMGGHEIWGRVSVSLECGVPPVSFDASPVL